MSMGHGADENDGEQYGDEDDDGDDNGDDDDDDHDNVDDDDDNGDGDDDDGTTRAPPFKILELRAGLVEGGVAGSRAGRWAPHL